MFNVTVSGQFKETLNKWYSMLYKVNALDKFVSNTADDGLRALVANTPVDTGYTASRWGYKINKSDGSYTITYVNDNMADQVPVVILLSNGHVTLDGGWVEGEDFIHEALDPIIEKAHLDLVKEVSK